MSVPKPVQYQQVLLKTVDGIFAVSVAGDIELDAKRRIVNPKDVFAPNSIIVAVQQGVAPSGVTVEQRPWDPGRDQPDVDYGPGPMAGVFSIRFLEGDKVELREMPSLGQIS